MSASFTNQTLAQIELFTNPGKYEKKVYTLPKHLDEKVARLHLAKIGAKLTKLRPDQSDYIGVPVERTVQAGPLPVLALGHPGRVRLCHPRRALRDIELASRRGRRPRAERWRHPIRFSKNVLSGSGW